MIHPKDKSATNPRLQCSVCHKWMRLHRAKPDPQTGHSQRFFGGCSFTRGDHLAGDKMDVCDDCCRTECKRLAELCDCQDATGSAGVKYVSMECPVHNENPVKP
jgi:hypothetical protein